MRTSLFVVSLLCAMASSAQFASKKAEKLYYKLDDAYLDYDYGTILDNEDKINEWFLANNDTIAANAYTYLAEAYEYEYGELDKALEFYTREYHIRKELTPEDAADVLFNVASLSLDLGRTREAEELYLELVESDKAKYGDEDPSYWATEISLLDFYSFSLQPKKGLEATKRLKRTFDSDSEEEAIRLKSEGDFNEMMGNYSKAERQTKKALRLWEDLDLMASQEYAATLSLLSTIYTNVGKLPQAEELLVEAMEIINRLDEAEEIAGALKNNLAQLKFELGNYAEAEETYVELLDEDKELFGEESANYAISAYALALNQIYAGKYSDAEKYLDLAQSVMDVAMDEDDPYHANILNNRAFLNIRRGDPDMAIIFGEQATKKYEEIYGPDHVETAWPYFNLGNANMGIDEDDKAGEWYQKALEIREKAVGKKHPFYARSTNQLAILEWKRGNFDEALKYFNTTFENYYNQINTYFPILSEEQKTKFYYNKLRPTVEQFSAFVIKATLEDESLKGQMYDLQLTLKGIILSATNKVKQSILTSGDSVLIGKYEEWLAQKEQLAQLFSNASLSDDERNTQIEDLTASSDNLEKELSKLSAGFAKTIENKQVTWKDIQAKLKPGEAAIEMVRFRDFRPDSAGIFTDEVFYAALILRHDTEDYPELVILRNGALLEGRGLSTYRNSIKYKIDETRSYTTFWRPIANRLEGINKIYFSPDGVYNQISIYTLKNPQTKKFNIDEFDIQLLNNTKDLVTRASASSKRTGKSIFFGFPNYNMGSIEEEEKRQNVATSGAAASVVQAATENRGRGGNERGGRGGRGGGKNDELDLTQVSIPRGLRGNMLRYMRSNSLLVLLPGTKKEVELIDSLYENRNIEREVYLANEAIEEQIKELNYPQSLHIATHGFFLEDPGPSDGQSDNYVENPLLRSGLILAGANSFIRSGEIGANLGLDEDGILTAYEAMNLPLDDTEIVVLSACETGLGEVKNGEGVFGLQRAFQIAGAEAIIMSMWTVDDAGTQELMTNFYEEWLKSGDKHEAFNIAQQRLKEKWKSPYYWGAFVMVGN